MLEINGTRDFIKSVGHRMRVARVDARLSLAKVGHALGVSAQTISSFERGNLLGGPSIGQVYAFCVACDCSIADILTPRRSRNENHQENWHREQIQRHI